MKLYRFTIPSDYPQGTEGYLTPAKRKGVYIEAQNLSEAKEEVAAIFRISAHLLSPDMGFLKGTQIVFPFL